MLLTEVGGLASYYTLSGSGVTHFADGAAEFCSLGQWEHEYALHVLLRRVRVFRMFRLWKPFRLWRRAVTQRRMAHCREVLERSLFMLNPILRGPLLSIR